MSDETFLHEEYGLRQEPFKDNIARQTLLKTWVDREEQVDVWTRVIGDSVSVDKNFLVFIVGSYGRGKTLSLLKVLDEAKKHKQIFPVFMNFKGEERTKPGLDFMFRIFKSVNYVQLRGTKSDEELHTAIKELPGDLSEPKTILEKIYFGNYQKLAQYFLSGEVKPSKQQLLDLEIMRTLSSVDIAKEYLAGLLALLHRLGFSTLMLIIDEFEYLFSLVSKSQQGIYLALLRNLYDFPVGLPMNTGPLANLSFFVGISEDGRSHLKDLEDTERSFGGPINPLMRRVDAETTLGVFSKEQTRKLIENRLRYNRVRGKYEDKPLIPFAEDFVDFVYGATNGEPAKVIHRCDQVLDAGLAQRISILNKEFASRVLKERAF